jgi:hypothetical protein
MAEQRAKIDALCMSHLTTLSIVFGTVGTSYRATHIDIASPVIKGHLAHPGACENQQSPNYPNGLMHMTTFY